MKHLSDLGQNLVYDTVSSHKVLILKDKEWLPTERRSGKDIYQ